MKGLIIIAILLTVGIIVWQFKKNKDIKKLLISLGTFGFIVSLAVMGNLTRSVIPIYIAHLILIIGAWGSLLTYMYKDRYYWYVILSPVITIGLFLLLEMYTGSSNEIG